MTEEDKGTGGGFFSRLKKGLKKTRNTFSDGLDNVIHGKADVGPELIDEIEEVLLLADVGIHTTQKLLYSLKKDVESMHIREPEKIRAHLKNLMTELLLKHQSPLDPSTLKPFVILVIGINGSGKTTTIAKLAQRWKNSGLKVMLAAGDTFRAAATEQLTNWSEKIDIPIIKQSAGADPSAVAYDAVSAAVSRKTDLVLIDTAGRLQTNQNLMEELKKIKRVVSKVMESAPHETLLVLDATLGQNSISQARLFHEAMNLDGLVMTKLDGTGRGGILFQVVDELNLPIRFIGVGEKAEDLQSFDPQAFVEALFEK